MPKDTINTDQHHNKTGSIDKKQLDDTYDKVIKRIQTEMSPSSRLISKIIHLKPIEIVSDTLSSTIARPSSMLIGSVLAFVTTLSIYILSMTIGYTLSGSEAIISFLIGWSIGIVYDLIQFILPGGNK